MKFTLNLNVIWKHYKEFWLIPGVGSVGALKSTEWSGRIFNRSNTLEMECGAQLQ